MPRVIYIVLITCIATAVHSAPYEWGKYKSNMPLLNACSTAAITGLHALRNSIFGSQSMSYALDWYHGQQKPLYENESIQWLGHASCLIKTQGCTILTDPVFWNIPFHNRYMPLGINPEQLPEIDCILISHDHYDHFNKDTLRYIRKQQNKEPIVLCPYGMESSIRQCGYNQVIPKQWWETVYYSKNSFPISFSCVPAYHWSGRSPFSINQSLWCGWIVTGTTHYYFAGDTAYNAAMLENITQFAKIDIALLPIGPCCTGTQQQHMGPTDIPRAIQILQPDAAIPIHWGVFALGPDTPEKTIHDLHTICTSNPVSNQKLYTLTAGGIFQHAKTYKPPSGTSKR